MTRIETAAIPKNPASLSYQPPVETATVEADRGPELLPTEHHCGDACECQKAVEEPEPVPVDVHIGADASKAKRALAEVRVSVADVPSVKAKMRDLHDMVVILADRVDSLETYRELPLWNRIKLAFEAPCFPYERGGRDNSTTIVKWARETVRRRKENALLNLVRRDVKHVTDVDLDKVADIFSKLARSTVRTTKLYPAQPCTTTSEEACAD